jgi:two-component system, chemotaxis family, chemotaxis protein CheY
MTFTVLIVDDSPVMRTFIRRVMKLAGFEEAEYLEACDGQEALEHLKTCHVDVILTDINMPRMNGEQLLEELAKNGTLKTTPAVVISTDATRDRVHRMLALGAKGYISKPFAPEALREELDRVLGEQNAARS